MNDYVLAALLGIVEGLTEFLPVSSTAHLRIVEALLGVDLGNAYWKTFSIVIQLGAILCLPLYFRHRLAAFIRTFPRGTRGIQLYAVQLGFMAEERAAAIGPDDAILHMVFAPLERLGDPLANPPEVVGMNVGEVGVESPGEGAWREPVDRLELRRVQVVGHDSKGLSAEC